MEIGNTSVSLIRRARTRIFILNRLKSIIISVGLAGSSLASRVDAHSIILCIRVLIGPLGHLFLSLEQAHPVFTLRLKRLLLGPLSRSSYFLFLALHQIFVTLPICRILDRLDLLLLFIRALKLVRTLVDLDIVFILREPLVQI